MKKRRRIKQRWVIAVVVVLVLLVALGALYLWQQENLKAAANARKYTQQELQQQLTDSRDSVQKTLEQHSEIKVRDLTEDERKELRSGDLSPEELVKRLVRPEQQNGEASTESAPPQGTPDTPVQTTPPASAAPNPVITPTPTQAPHEPTQQELYEAALSELIAQVLVLREQYTAKLDAMYAQAKAEYSAMPESERTKAKLSSWAGGYASLASALEKDCDAQMDAILAEMSRLIKANNGDASILKTMAYSYAEEKSIQKSIYIQKLEKRGII